VFDLINGETVQRNICVKTKTGCEPNAARISAGGRVFYGPHTAEAIRPQHPSSADSSRSNLSKSNGTAFWSSRGRIDVTAWSYLTFLNNAGWITLLIEEGQRRVSTGFPRIHSEPKNLGALPGGRGGAGVMRLR
jgi:hypothetical protein